MSASWREAYGGAGITHEEGFNMSDIKDDKSMSSGGKEGGGKEGTDRNKTGAERQPGTGAQPGQREQSTGQPGSGGQQGGQNPNRGTQQGGKSSDDMQSKDPGQKGKS
jgi:hypothetical protein